MPETDDNLNAYRLRELTEGLDRLAALAHGIGEGCEASPIAAVWDAAPLTLKLRFMRDLLPDSSELQPALSQALALTELRLRGDELKTWLSSYPAQFADGLTLLQNSTQSILRNDAPAIAAVQTLTAALKELENSAAAYGVDWINSTPGDPITAEHEVISEQASSFHKGAIAVAVRRGFRVQGRLGLPAQVIRSSGNEGNWGNEGNEGKSRAISERFGFGVAEGSEAIQGNWGNEGNDAPQAPDTPHLASPPSSGSGPPDRSVPERTWGEESRSVLTPNTEHLAPVSSVLTPNTEHLAPGSSVLTPNTEHLTPGLAEHRTPVPPPWLTILGQRTHGCNVEAVLQLIDSARRLANVVCAGSQIAADELRELVEPLLPVLSMRYPDSIPGIPAEWGTALFEVRDSILEWLRETLSIEPIIPKRGDLFDVRLMRAVETKRTVHANEMDTVARLDRIGLSRDGLPIVPADVAHYGESR